MCDDQSPSSCRISSAKSVSSAWMPASARAAFRWISSVVSDFIFTTSLTPWARATSTTTALASAASLAQWTWPPALTTADSNCTRYSSRCARTSALMALPASRSSSQSGSSPTTLARFRLDRVGGRAQVGAELDIDELALCRLREALDHASSAARISARCIVRIREPRRPRPPPICNRQDASTAVHTSAPLACGEARRTCPTTSPPTCRHS